MKTGTAEKEFVSKGSRMFKRRISGHSGTGGGPNGGDGSDGDERQLPEPLVDDLDARPEVDKSRYIALFLLLAVGMTFAGLLGAYLMIATNKAAEWRPFDLPFQIWISSALILASSFAFTMANRSIAAFRYDNSRKWLIATTIFGSAFVSSQFLVWIALAGRGLYVAGNPYAGFFYILTGAHLVHVAGGIIALGSVLLRNWHPARSPAERQKRTDVARSVGWYWHFMGLLWFVLVVFLGFWK
ncbi:MAG TPA: cytochrome c oxidase subunit 3 [Pyrinomonadaceae bacterium]|nr:cytochrome c oxidase subunit 3 [Pyrinomonadaceae bacterium]